MFLWDSFALVSVELVDSFRKRIGYIRGFALYDGYRQSVYEYDYIRDDVLFQPVNFELVNYKELVVFNVIEVNDFYGLALASGS